MTRFEAIVKPALHTFWQSFAGLLAAWWVASGLALAHSVTDVASAKRVALSAIAAVLAMGLSAAKSTLTVYLDSKKSGISDVPDPDPTPIFEQAVTASSDVAEHAFMSGKSPEPAAPITPLIPPATA